MTDDSAVTVSLQHTYGKLRISGTLIDIYRSAIEDELKHDFKLALMGPAFGPPKPPKPVNTRRYPRSTRYRAMNKMRYYDDY